MKMYKLLYKFRGELHSWGAGGTARVIYEPGKWIEAPAHLAKMGYHIVVFDDLEDTDTFPYDWRPGPIWEVDAEDEVPLPPRASLVRLNDGVIVQSGEWPPGTRMFKRVRLIKEVNDVQVSGE